MGNNGCFLCLLLSVKSLHLQGSTWVNFLSWYFEPSQYFYRLKKTTSPQHQRMTTITATIKAFRIRWNLILSFSVAKYLGNKRGENNLVWRRMTKTSGQVFTLDGQNILELTLLFLTVFFRGTLLKKLLLFLVWSRALVSVFLKIIYIYIYLSVGIRRNPFW